LNTIQFGYMLEAIRRSHIFEGAILYKKIDEKWGAIEPGGKEDDEELIRAFSEINSARRFFKIKKPNRLIISFGKEKFAISIGIGVRINAVTVEKYIENLDACEQSSRSLFHANHDELTNVLNRNGIKHKLDKNLKKSGGGEGESSANIVGRDELVIYSFDVDKFKSVNDTYGHEAGDVVLASFASRLSKFILILESEYSAKFIFGRPGGEEFELIILGNLSLKDKKEIGDRLINAVRNPGLPSSKEIAEFGIKKKSKSDQDYPNGVKVSIGIAWGNDGGETEDRENIHKAIRKQADAALYRAKSDGRNCVRIYDDIKSKHGRIVKYFNDSEVIQIDIGSSVGVESGNVFLVNFPPFTGNENVQEREGSEKILGKYPNIESAKIIVIDSEREFSTCIVLEKINNNGFPKGARLTYVHIGSNVPFFDRVIDLNRSLGKYSDFFGKVNNLIGVGRLGAVCRLSGEFKKSKEFDQEISFDAMSNILSIVFPEKTYFFKPYSGGLYAVVEKFDDALSSRQEKINEIYSRLKSFFVNLSMQVCVPEMLPDDVSCDAEAIAFYCQSSIVRRVKNKIEPYFFSGSSPVDVIYGWRDDASYKDALLDYKLFKYYGFSSPNLDNQIGLSILEADAKEYFLFSEMAFIDASTKSDLEGDNFSYKANLSTIRAKMGKFHESYSGFRLLDVEKIVVNDTYAIAYAKSIVEEYEIGGIVPSSELGLVLLKAFEILSKGNKNNEDYVWINKIGAMLKTKYFD
jgi:diguanylate cyclase (GGDEF)-like protein